MPMKLLALLSKCCLAIPITFKVDFRGRHVAPGGPVHEALRYPEDTHKMHQTHYTILWTYTP